MTEQPYAMRLQPSKRRPTSKANRKTNEASRFAAWASLHPLPGFALADKSKSTALEIEGIGSFQGDDSRIGLAVLGVEHVAAPLVVSGLGGTVHDHRSDLTLSALILDRDDLAAELAATIVEVDLRTSRRAHPRSKRLLGPGLCSESC